MKLSKILAALFAAAIVTGCASVELNADGGNGASYGDNDIMQQLARDSQGGDA